MCAAFFFLPSSSVLNLRPHWLQGGPSCSYSWATRSGRNLGEQCQFKLKGWQSACHSLLLQGSDVDKSRCRWCRLCTLRVPYSRRQELGDVRRNHRLLGRRWRWCSGCSIYRRAQQSGLPQLVKEGRRGWGRCRCSRLLIRLCYRWLWRSHHRLRQHGRRRLGCRVLRRRRVPRHQRRQCPRSEQRVKRYLSLGRRRGYGCGYRLWWRL